jgi:hypothetical protein
MKDKVHTIESRDIVKENASLYRESELARQRREDMAHFIQVNPPINKDVEKILHVFVD